MSKIRIKNFGPIKEGFKDANGEEWMDIKKVTVFVGNQGSGKSTVAKLISTMTWLEKALYRGEVTKEEMTAEEFINENCGYHRINNYITDETEIQYKGDVFSIVYKDKSLIYYSQANEKDYSVPKIMYVPAERNFLSTVEEADNVIGLPKPLYTFSAELSRSRKELTGKLELPISKLEYEYNKGTETSEIIGKGYRINLLEASSGLQSSVPLFLVSRNLALSINKKQDPSKMNISLKQAIRRDSEIDEVKQNHELTNDQKEEKIEFIKAKYQNHCFINIVEEIEQNLFPTSQRHILNSLLGFNNLNIGNELVITTHSPYIINYLTLAIKAFFVSNKIELSNKKDDLYTKLNKIVPAESRVNSNNLVIYELDEQNGTIKKLDDYKGLPSDENYLNERMAEGNELFAELLEIEDLCQ